MSDNRTERPSQGLMDVLRRRGVLRVAFSYALIAWLLLQIGDVVLDPIGAPAWVMRALIVLVVAGFPIALLLAWFFELTPNGIERDHLAPEAGRPAVSGIRRYSDMLVIAVLSLTVIFLLARQQGWIEEETGTPVIAVLPFNELGAPDDSYFGAGLADTLIQNLGQLGKLIVLASSSTLEFRGPGLDLRSVGVKLGANSILQGTVQRASGQLRINARLVDVESGRQLWSGSYERQSSDLFEVQDEIARAVTEALKVVLSPGEEQRLGVAPTLSLTAYDAYLLGRAKLAERDPEHIQESIGFFREAIARDPDYALAHAALAESMYLTTAYRGRPEDWDSMGPDAHRAAATAQSLNPELGDAYLAQALAATGDNDFGEPDTWPDAHIAALLKHALQLSPNNAAAMKWYANYATSADEKLATLLRAARLDPRSSIIRMNVGESYRDRGEFDRARDWMLKSATAGDRVYQQAYRSINSMYFRDAVQLDEAARWGLAYHGKYPDGWGSLAAEMRPLIELGLWDSALEVWRGSPVPAGSDSESWRLWVHLYDGARLAAAMGDIDTAEQLAQSFQENFLESVTQTYAQPSWTVMLDILAMADIRRGKPDAALERYERKVPVPENWYYSSYMSVYLPTPVMIAALYRLSGDTVRAERILRDFLQRTENDPIKGEEGIGFLRFMLHAALGETDAAITALESAVDAGWLPGWWSLQSGSFDANYAKVIADPRFIRLYREIEGRVTRMRADFLAHPELPDGMEVE